LANQQIPNLPAAITLSGAEQFEAVQAGVSVKVDATQLAAYANAVYVSPGASAILDTLGSTRGSLLYRGATNWTTLPPGAAGQVVTANGTGEDPTWGAAVSGVVSVSSPLTLAGTVIGLGVVPGALGGTGVANTGKTITLSGDLETSGAYNSVFTFTGATSVTFPTSGTLATVGAPVLEPFTSKTANYTITTADSIILCLTNAFTLTLPTAVGLNGRKFTIKNGNTIASGNNITMATTSAQTVDGGVSGAITPLSSQTFLSDGSNWWII
jgi:hypothetical protein